jgi:hypothetical protein
MNSCLLPPLLLQKNSNKWIIYDMNSSFASRTPSSISRFSSMVWTINHLNNYIWHHLAKSSRLKPSCPSFQYQANVILKLMVTPYHHYKKSYLFLLGKLIEKVTFCTFDNLTKELLWTSWFEHACFDQSSRWTCVKLTIGFLYQHFKLHFD